MNYHKCENNVKRHRGVSNNRMFTLEIWLKPVLVHHCFNLQNVFKIKHQFYWRYAFSFIKKLGHMLLAKKRKEKRKYCLYILYHWTNLKRIKLKITSNFWLSIHNKLHIFRLYGSYKVIYKVRPRASYTSSVPLYKIIWN